MTDNEKALIQTTEARAWEKVQKTHADWHLARERRDDPDHVEDLRQRMVWARIEWNAIDRLRHKLNVERVKNVI